MNGDYFSLLFWDSFWGSLIISPESELVVFVMFIFGGFPVVQVIATAILGSMCGVAGNWGLGKMIIEVIRMNKFSQDGEAGFSVFTTKAKKYGKWLLLISPWFGVFDGPIALIAGIVGVRIPLFLLLATIGRLIFYTYQYLAFQGVVPEISLAGLWLLSTTLRSM